MYILKIIIVISICSLFFACGNSPIENPPNLEPRNSKTWGAPTNAIDFMNQKSLLNDDRVEKVHKTENPSICEEYVLWRVKHDGSCWLSSGMTQLFYHMIEGGEAKFDEAVEYLKDIFPKDDESRQDFFDILALIREKMDHRFSLEIRNHSRIYETLDNGFRKLLSNYYIKNDEKAKKIAKAYSWGYASDFEPLFRDLGFKYAEIITNGKFGGSSPTHVSLIYKDKYFTEEEFMRKQCQ